MTTLEPHARSAVADDDLTDEELVSAMRRGDDRAYELLWKRHVTTARRVANRLAPSQADDLVSEAFLAVYDQIRTRGRGPTDSFRPYLFAVMRNTSARWYREGSRLSYEPEPDIAVEDEGLQGLERAHDAAVLLAAFRALPERWQRVLWLSDVADAPRSTIAAELGLRPNAVSALYRRARTGLRTQWLLEQVPAALRADTAHTASLLPALIVSGKSADTAETMRHVRSCKQCHEVDRELRAAYRDGRKKGLSAGPLAALGVVLPAASTAWTAAAPPTAVAALGLGGSAAALAGLLALGIGAGIVAPVILPWPGAAPALPTQSSETAEAAGDDTLPPSASLPNTAHSATPITGTTPTPSEEEVPTIDVFADTTGTGDMPTRPAPRPPETPGTVITPNDGAAGAPTVISSNTSSSYLAPTLSGTVPADSEVAIRVGTDVYRAEQPTPGAWTFDLRSLVLPAGDHTASVWTITEGKASAASEIAFSVTPLGLTGFPEYAPITLRESMDQGLTFTVTGAPGGTVCLDSDTGQSVVIPLDREDGTATRRIRFFTYGLYVLRLTACEGGSFGPDTPRTVSIVEGVFDPWVEDDQPYWEIDEP